MQVRSVLIGLGIVIVVVAIALSISGRSAQTAPGQQSASNTPLVSDKVTERTVGMDVILTTQFFSPDAMELHEGDSLALTVSSPDADHTIVIPGTGQSLQIAKGTTETITTPTLRTGTLVAYCTLNCEQNVTFTAPITTP